MLSKPPIADVKYYDKRFMKLLSLEILNTQNSNSGNPVQCYIKTILTLTVRETHIRVTKVVADHGFEFSC